MDWTALTASVGDVAISIPAEGAPPLTATIGDGHIKLAWSGLGGIAGGQIHITEIVARQATFSLCREWIDAFQPPKRKPGSPVAVQIDRLIVDDATAEYMDLRDRVRVKTSALNFRGHWSLATGATYEKVDANKVKFVLPLKPREKQKFTYDLTVHHGINVSR